MEMMLGRQLLPHEHVHHKHGNKQDNDPDHLELWVKAHPYGQRVEDLIAFICKFYPNETKKALMRT